MEERARPTGEICCYKQKKSVKKKPTASASAKKKSKTAKKGATCLKMYEKVPKAFEVIEDAAAACGVSRNFLLPAQRRLAAALPDE